MSIKTLARSLDLSTATVSRALNGFPEVNAATRERVFAQAAIQGYTANPTARRLVTGRTDTVGWVYPSDTSLMGDEQFLTTIAGVTDALGAAKRDFHIVTARVNDEMNVYHHLVRSRLVDAVIVARCQRVDARIEYLIQSKFPFVAYGRSDFAHAQAYSWFDFDNRQAGRLAVAHLHAKGHQRIAYLHDDLAIGFAQGRHQGYMQGLESAQISPEKPLCAQAGHTQKAGFDTCMHLLEQTQRPSALIIDNAWAGVGALKAIAQLGLQLKRDIDVVVCNGIPDAYTDQYRDISIVRFGDPDTIGRQLATMVLAQLANGVIEQVLWQPSILSVESPH